MVMETVRALEEEEEDGALWRKLLSAEEDRRTDRSGGYRWFRSENVVCIEHFRRPHIPAQKAGRFGWMPMSK
jgi:hypothetical protein